ncbi:MAG TPA: DUF4159 domain-containing protein [Flavobacteriaceae bacterium]|nr:DUF4159 domain-containing protein [Flavobacteriaceae bacterium]
MKKLFFLISLVSIFQLSGQEIALLKYNGGGDWYANPTSLPNLIAFSNETIHTSIVSEPATVEPGSQAIFQYPFVHMTGHGNVFFNEDEVQNLRDYLLSGGFLHADDNYGMDEYIRREIAKIFPDEELVELPADHPIFSSFFTFENGLPKIHEHDGKRPQAFGVFHRGRLMLLYTYESDLGDGWENPEVHNDPEAVHLKALQMGANILAYIFKH